MSAKDIKNIPVSVLAEYWNNPSQRNQIRAFTRRANMDVGPDAGKEILGILRPFLLPILENLREGVKTTSTWPPGGPWR